jgi:hypothetical protein
VKERIFIESVILKKCDFVAAFNQQCAGGMAKNKACRLLAAPATRQLMCNFYLEITSLLLVS